MEKVKSLKCPLCGFEMATSAIEARRYTNEQGTVVERRCAGCGKVLAAYFDEEGSFLPRIRTF